jgi:hypothetical protein
MQQGFGFAESFFDYKIAYSKDSECTESLDVFTPADALHVKYPLSPITIYATKPKVEQYKTAWSLSILPRLKKHRQ